MSEERLNEIRDSIEFQMQIQQAVGYKSRYDDLLVEEIDLYNEVIDLKAKIDSMTESYETDAEAKFYEYVDKHESKLQQRIDKAIEFICKKDMEANLKGEAVFNSNELLEILKGEPNNE